MTILRKNLFLLIFLFISMGCGGSEPVAQPAALAHNQPALALPTVSPAQPPPLPTPTATTVVINDTAQEYAVSAEAWPETENGAVDNSATLSQASSVDLTRLPIGDHRVSTGPVRGYVWSCQTVFNGGGAFETGSWFNAAAGTYDYTAKPIVDGAVSWPHQFTITLEGAVRVIAGNDLPNHPTGNYPISPSDDAYYYDRNPNSIAAQSLRLELPAVPTIAARPSCIGGAAGVLLTGVMLYNAFDAGGRDAVAHELQDSCQGHPEARGNYHYHNLTSCIDDGEGGHSPLVGYAFDGFGLYGHHGEDGQELTNADLDECHGHSHTIEWDGRLVEMYHYHATWEFPYTLGCYRGTPAVDMRNFMGGPGGQPGGQPPAGGLGQPPQGQPLPGNPPLPGPSNNQHPNLAVAAAKLGITEQQLREALGPPPPDFAAAAAKLGISEQVLRQALGLP